jgi:Leucine Rich repeat
MCAISKSLFAAGVVVAAVLGHSAAAPVPEVKKAKGSAISRAIEAFDKVGGAYGVRTLGGDAFAATAKKLGYDPRAYYDVRSLAFGRIAGKEPLGDTGLEALVEHIGVFPGLDVLDLRGNDLTAKGVLSLPPLPKLQKLVLDGADITDEAVGEAAIRFPELTTLELVNTTVTAAGEEKIQKLLPKCKISRVSTK